MAGLRFFGSALVVAALMTVGTYAVVPAGHASASGPPTHRPAKTAPAPTIPPPVGAPPHRAAAPDPTPLPPKFIAVPREDRPASTGTVPRGAGKVMYLSFDDGPHPTWTPKVLDLLSRHGAHATFFQIGNQADQYPAVAASVRSRGNTVGNHTWDHPDLTSQSAEGIAAQITRTTGVIGATRCTRPPMGLTNPAVAAALGRQGQRQQMWDIDTRDWQRPGADRIVATVLAQARSGAVILMHDGGGDRSQTVAALGRLLPELSKAGWRLEAIPGC